MFEDEREQYEKDHLITLYKQKIAYREEDIKILSDNIRTLHKEIADLYTKIEFEKTGLSVGSLVQRRDKSTGVLVKFEQYGGWSWRKLKKDGTPANQVTYVGCNITKVEENI